MRTSSTLPYWLLALVLSSCGGKGASADLDATGPSVADAGVLDAAVLGADAGVNAASDFYDSDTVVDIRLTVATTDIAILDANPFAKIYVPGTFESMGVVVANVGVRYKGNSSLARAGNKPSFKVKFNENVVDQRFLGLTKVDLNNTVLDPSMQREMIAYELFRDFGVPASRANFARVFVNGTLNGLYINVEHVNKRMLSRVFGENEGNLYKQSSGSSLEYLGSNPSAYAGSSYEKKTNEIENDWTGLIALCELLDSDQLSLIESQLPQIFDTSGFLRWMAVNTYLSHIDAYTGFANNFYLYRSSATNKFVYIPWDLDITFGTQGHAGTTDQFLLNWNLYDPQIPTPTGPRPLLTKMMAITSFRTEYTGYLVELVDGGNLQSTLTDRISEVRTLITPFATADTRKPYTNEEFTNSLSEGVPAPGDTNPVIGLRAFVEQRTPIVTGQLPLF